MVLATSILLDALCLAMYDNSITTTNILKDLLVIQDDKSNSAVEGFNDASIQLYTTIIRDIVDNSLDINNDNEIDTLLLKLSRNVEDENVTDDIKIIKRIAKNRKSISELRVEALRHRIKHLIATMRGSAMVKDLFRNGNKMFNTTNPAQQSETYNELIRSAKKLVTTYENSIASDNSKLEDINCDDDASLLIAVQRYKLRRSCGGHKMGLKHFGGLFGEADGPLPGQCIGIASRTHNFKTGSMLKIARWIATWGKGKQTDKQSVVVFVSLENEVYDNLVDMYQDFYYSTYLKAAPDCKKLTAEDLVDRLKTMFKRMNVRFLFHRALGSSFGYEDWVRLHDELEQSHEILVSILDYPGKMKLPTDSQLRDDQKRAQLISDIKDYGSIRNMTTVLGFQLNGNADLLDQDKTKLNQVRLYNSGYLAASKAVAQELDVLIFSRIEVNHQKEIFLTFWLAKLRGDKMPDNSQRYAAYLFNPAGILDDIHGDCTHVSDIYDRPTIVHSADPNAVPGTIPIPIPVPRPMPMANTDTF